MPSCSVRLEVSAARARRGLIRVSAPRINNRGCLRGCQGAERNVRESSGKEECSLRTRAGSCRRIFCFVSFHCLCHIKQKARWPNNETCSAGTDTCVHAHGRRYSCRRALGLSLAFPLFSVCLKTLAGVSSHLPPPPVSLPCLAKSVFLFCFFPSPNCVFASPLLFRFKLRTQERGVRALH